MKTIATFFISFALILLSACGGGGSTTSSTTPQPTYASELSYQNPDAAGFRFITNTAASSKKHLVLDLVGPSGTQTKGLAFFLSADTSKVTWTHPAGTSGTYISPGNVFPLGTSPQLLKHKVTGNQLQVGIFQKSGDATTLDDAAILSIALDLKGAAVSKGNVLFAPQSGKQALLLQADGTLTPITLSVGSLSAK
jgi:hypothetical protein